MWLISSLSPSDSAKPAGSLFKLFFQNLWYVSAIYVVMESQRILGNADNFCAYYTLYGGKFISSF